MDGRGRAFDNIFIGRLCRSARYEGVQLNGCQTVMGAMVELFLISRYVHHPHKTKG